MRQTEQVRINLDWLLDIKETLWKMQALGDELAARESRQGEWCATL